MAEPLDPPWPEIMACATCAHFAARPAVDAREAPPEQPQPIAGNECRRYPPTIEPPYYRARFPPTAPDAWCGEYKARPVARGLPPAEMA